MADLSSRTRICRVCRIEKDLVGHFYLKSGRGRVTLERYDTRCRTCANIATHAYQTHPDRVGKVLEYKRRYYHRVGKYATRDRSYKKFKADCAAYDLQVVAQDGRCAICLRLPADGEMRFAFDHDHDTGLARGVLCAACNGGLGCFRDQPTRLLAALRYLEYWHEQHTLTEGTHGL